MQRIGIEEKKLRDKKFIPCPQALNGAWLINAISLKKKAK